MAKILLIEDEALVAQTLKKIVLRKGGHVAVVAGNGALGSETYGSETPDLVITGCGTACDDLHLLNTLGVNETIQKPFADANFLAIVQKTLEPRAA